MPLPTQEPRSPRTGPPRPACSPTWISGIGPIPPGERPDRFALVPGAVEERRYSARTVLVVAAPPPPALPRPASTRALMALLYEVAARPLLQR